MGSALAAARCDPAPGGDDQSARVWLRLCLSPLGLVTERVPITFGGLV